MSDRDRSPPLDDRVVDDVDAAAASPSSETEPGPRPLLIGFEEARQLLGVSRTTLYRLVKPSRDQQRRRVKPKIPGVIRLGGQWRFNYQILLDFIGCKGPGSPPE